MSLSWNESKTERYGEVTERANVTNGAEITSVKIPIRVFFFFIVLSWNICANSFQALLNINKHIKTFIKSLHLKR